MKLGSKITLAGAVLFVAYTFASTINGKLYNDCQRAIERNEIIAGVTSAEFPESPKKSSFIDSLKEWNAELTKTRDKTKKSILYYPMGLMYDVLEGRL